MDIETSEEAKRNRETGRGKNESSVDSRQGQQQEGGGRCVAAGATVNRNEGWEERGGTRGGQTAAARDRGVARLRMMDGWQQSLG